MPYPTCPYCQKTFGSFSKSLVDHLDLCCTTFAISRNIPIPRLDTSEQLHTRKERANRHRFHQLLSEHMRSSVQAPSRGPQSAFAPTFGVAPQSGPASPLASSQSAFGVAPAHVPSAFGVAPAHVPSAFGVAPAHVPSAFGIAPAPTGLLATYLSSEAGSRSIFASPAPAGVSNAPSLFTTHRSNVNPGIASIFGASASTYPVDPPVSSSDDLFTFNARNTQPIAGLYFARPTHEPIPTPAPVGLSSIPSSRTVVPYRSPFGISPAPAPALQITVPVQHRTDTCPICLEIDIPIRMFDPVCTHGVCDRCCEQLRSFQCPVCRADTYPVFSGPERETISLRQREDRDTQSIFSLLPFLASQVQPRAQGRLEDGMFGIAPSENSNVSIFGAPNQQGGLFYFR